MRSQLFIVDDEYDAVTAALDCGAARRMRLPAFDADNASATFDTPAIGVHDPLCIIYTSGTTGAPGVVFTHRMMRIASEAALKVADVRDGDRLFLWEPLCHIGGAQMLLLPFMENVTLHAVPRFSASQFWPQIERAGATQLHYLGGVLDILMQLPESAQPPTHTLRVAWGAGVSAPAWEPIQARLAAWLRECYGMTECASFATMNVTGKPGSIGRPLPWIDIELLDENGQPVAEGEAGEIVLASRVEGTFLPAYLHNPAATHAAMRHGKLHTGDRAPRCRRRLLLRRPSDRQHARAQRERVRMGDRARVRRASGDTRERGNRRGIGDWRAGHSAQRAVRGRTGGLGSVARMGARAAREFSVAALLPRGIGLRDDGERAHPQALAAAHGRRCLGPARERAGVAIAMG